MLTVTTEEKAADTLQKYHSMSGVRCYEAQTLGWKVWIHNSQSSGSVVSAESPAGDLKVVADTLDEIIGFLKGVECQIARSFEATVAASA